MRFYPTERGGGETTGAPEVAAIPAAESASRALPTVAVVIATRHRPALLKRCLAAVVAQELRPAEILVVDNTEGEKAARTAALSAGARYLVEPTPGLSRARNHGACETGAEIVAFIDDDAVPDPNWLSALTAEFADPRVAAVAGRILSLPASGSRSSEIFGGSERIVLDQDKPEWFERASFGGLGQGSNLALRHSVFSTWPGFDERLGAGTSVGGMEEHHAFFSLIARGHRVVYTPAAVVLHPSPGIGAELVASHLRHLTATSFYIAMLMVEEPRHRWRAAKYAFEALRATPRTWRTVIGSPTAPILRRQKVRAFLAGVRLYLLSRIDLGRRESDADRSSPGGSL